MYLKKVDGPRAVTLANGQVMTRSDLPDPMTVRWVASRKASVVRAVQAGLVTAQEVQKTYGLSEEELESWSGAVARFGEAALKTTRIQKYRQL